MSDSLWLDAGRALTKLEPPMDKDEIRAFAEQAINATAKLANYELRHRLVFGYLVLKIGERGATEDDLKLIASALLDAVDKTKTLTEARSLLGSMWAGAVLERRH